MRSKLITAIALAVIVATALVLAGRAVAAPGVAYVPIPGRHLSTKLPNGTFMTVSDCHPLYNPSSQLLSYFQGFIISHELVKTTPALARAGALHAKKAGNC